MNRSSLLVTVFQLCVFNDIVSDAFPKSALRMVSYANPVAPELFPYVAELSIVWPNKNTICTGSLLSRSVMITAGHCVIDQKTGRLMGRIKKVVFRQKNGRSYVTRITGAVYGELDVPDIEEKKKVLDYALFTLEKPLPICRPICRHVFSIIKLPIRDIYACRWKPLQPSTSLLSQCSLLGYGSSEKGNPDGQLRELTNITVWEVSGRLLIPLEPDVQKGRTCSGDSGGPFICDTDYGQRIFGIVSHSEPLVESYPSTCHGEENAYLYDVMGDVRKMLPFIQESLESMGKIDELIEDYERCDP